MKINCFKDTNNLTNMVVQRLMAVFCIVFISSCEVKDQTNIYKSPKVKYELIENTIKIDKNNSVTNIKDKFQQDLLNNSNVIYIDSKEVHKYIDCGFMNDELYVHYIDRIFGSSLTAELIFNDIKKNDEVTLEILFQYTFKSKETGTTWRFTSKRSKNLLVGNPVYDDNPYRECLSKQKMESELRFVLE